MGLIFDSLSSLHQWQEQNDNVWQLDTMTSLDISQTALAVLRGEAHDVPESLRQFFLECLQVSASKRPDLTTVLGSDFFKEAEVQYDSPWVADPILLSDELPDPKGKDDEVLLRELEECKLLHSSALENRPIHHIYDLWRLAGGDVEIDLAKRGVFLSKPVIERLPRTCHVSDGTEVGANVSDTTQLYSDKVQVLGFKELYQRLEENKGDTGEMFEWDTDYFMVVDENDVNFLLDGSISDDEDEMPNDDDFIFAEDAAHPPSTPTTATNGVTPSGTPTPTTPSTSRSLNRTFSLSSMNRSRSSSSLSVGSPVPSTPTQPVAPKLPLFLREQDVNYQFHRQELFRELLRQYPASRKEILHHAKIDIPPLLRGKIWAAVLGVHGDVWREYDRIDKQNDANSDRQIDVGKSMRREEKEARLTLG